MAEFQNLIAQRKQLKSRLTRLNTFYNKHFVDNVTISKDKIAELRVRYEHDKELLSDFEKLYLEIIKVSNDPVHDTELEDFEESYYKIIAKIDEILQQRISTNLNSNAELRLPQITLPTFSGEYECWVEFHDAFDNIIHKNDNLTDVQKFYYLIGSLKGEAAQAVKTLKVSSDNYLIAWNLLKKRFENKKLIIQNNLKLLFNLEQIKKDTHTAIQRFLDEIIKIKESLKNYEQPTVDTLLIYIVSSKLSATTRYQWEQLKPEAEFPTFDELLKFLETRSNLLGSIEANQSFSNNSIVNHNDVPSYRGQNNGKTKSCLSAVKSACVSCQKDHAIYTCDQFLKLDINGRISEARRLRLCLVCLKRNHNTRDCSAQPCAKCSKKHNTLLHIETKNVSPPVLNKTEPEANDKAEFAQAAANIPQTLLSNHLNVENVNQVLLSTASVKVPDINGKLHNCRVLLDSGSQSNFISNEFCDRLGLQKFKYNMTITGINQKASVISSRTKVSLFSKVNNFSTSISCFILDQISDYVPLQPFNLKGLNIPSNIKLADLNCNIPGQIDMLIGSSLFWDLMCVGQIKLGNNQPILQKTKLGWILGGPISESFNNSLTCLSNQTLCLKTQIHEELIDNKISKFWELEECLSESANYSIEEKFCEEHFNKTFARDNSGRFIVSIPFKDNVCDLGTSRDLALKRFYSIERKLNKNSAIKTQYTEFVEEYTNLGHMTKISAINENEPHFYLPHHPVFKADSLTTKLRVVFDGSAKSSSGLSLNDVQYIGPTIQNDLFCILLRFRKHQFIISADIAKMYRQVLIKQDQRRFHLILWRSDDSKPVDTYCLNTVTYGTASASFLSIRCLKQLAIEFRDKYPESARIVENDFYVDDLLTGADSIDEVIQLQREITEILNSGQFELRKWSSNDETILEKLQPSEKADKNYIKSFEGSESKTLGVLYNNATDVLQYSTADIKNDRAVTKRTILSIICQIFDPLGLLGPITVMAKLIIQKLWQLKLSWDESIPLDLHTEWIKFQDEIHLLQAIKIPRLVICKGAFTIELHGFSDASEKAYGACIYIKSVNEFGCHVSLLCAKSRVAPLKNVTLPRLELCGAVLLAHLAEKVKKSLNINFNNCYFWCDSTIVLGWVKAAPNKWKTFVANRVADIQSKSNISDWRHVQSQDNPSDLISRGLEPRMLINSNLWWNGPKWLAKPKSEWPAQPKLSLETSVLEIRKQNIAMTACENFNIFERYSSVSKLQCVVSYCLRFANNCKRTNTKILGKITANEMQRSLLILLRICQTSQYSKEIRDLKAGNAIDRKSKLLPLNPILDNDGMLIVGGRIYQGNFNNSKKHPIILPPSHTLSKLIVQNEHIRLLHCGATMLLTSLRERYWPISGKNLVKHVIRCCVTCFRNKPTTLQPVMGPLPKVRLQQAPPFYNCGVDYAGPILIKTKKGRGARLIKSYICVFICLVTKAIHLELVSALSTEEFLSAFRRFISRRGQPLNIYSDNGTNFVGAKSELSELKDFITNDSTHCHITKKLLDYGTSWHFIPARSPHFGGIWEAGVKSVKFHLKRILGNAYFVYEELYTFLTQIEAVLNSRPLCPLSNDPDDMDPLTPAHFLIGRKLTSPADPNLLDVSDNRLTKYQHIQKLKQHFWSRWSREYVSQLQVRSKWTQGQPISLIPGALVILREDNVPPFKWQMARIADVHPGQDGVVRVVSVKLPNGVVTKRAVVKICVLPISDKDA